VVGVMTSPNEERYQGDWQEDKKQGQGIYYYPNGEKYDGEWINDQREGKGTFLL
jgi:hypothetical protein